MRLDHYYLYLANRRNAGALFTACEESELPFAGYSVVRSLKAKERRQGVPVDIVWDDRQGDETGLRAAFRLVGPQAARLPGKPA